jgi:putative transposase
MDPSRPVGQFENALAGSLGVVVGRYKTAVTTRINQLRHSTGAKVWQRGYYERIIRNQRELAATRQYIINNPRRWAEDRDNLDALLSKMTYHP